VNSIRTVVKAPGFTIAALLSLTIGIGATSASFNMTGTGARAVKRCAAR